VTDKQRRAWQWGVVGCYLGVVVAVVLGVAPIWCLGVVFALPRAVRVFRQAREVQRVAEIMPSVAEFATIFVGQVVVGYIIRGIVR